MVLARPQGGGEDSGQPACFAGIHRSMSLPFILIHFNYDIMSSRIAVLVVLVLLMGVYLGVLLTPQTLVVRDYNQSPVVITKYKGCLEATGDSASITSINIPAVDQEGNGVVTALSVQIIPGYGRILTNIDRLLFWVDTQNSIRTARDVASDITGVDLSQYDMIYTIKANASVIEGPSAGAALTIATIAAIQDRDINPRVTITGSINHDGTIGPVGEILPKAQAAKEMGAETLLVPLLQGRQVTYKTEKYCEQIGMTQICTMETKPITIDIGNETGIEVVEVKDISQALEYFNID